MQYSRTIGISAPEVGWVPSPGFILRRSALLDIIRDFNPGIALEIGCGPGGMLYELNRLGHVSTGIEVSKASREVSAYLLRDAKNSVVQESDDHLVEETFDYLFSFEVLEHIDDDIAAFTSWVSLVKPGGTIVVSVPAHQNRWNETDIMAGHFRRYSRDDVENIFKKSGVTMLQIQTYGWPASWFIEKIRLKVRNYQLRRNKVDLSKVLLGDVELSKKSGMDRTTEQKMFWLYGNKIVGQPIFWALNRLQRLFYNTDLGISYIAVGKKPHQKDIYEK